MEVRVIGSGGAFDTTLTNSSFIVSAGGSNTLVDCGYNVFAKLKELEDYVRDLISGIDRIYITHMDDDHIGSLNSLIYYRYFVLGLTTEVQCAAGIHEALASYLPENKVMSHNDEYGYPVMVNCVDKNIVNLTTINKLVLSNTTDKSNPVHINTVVAGHHTTTNGIVFYQSGGDLIYISGDTVPLKEIEKTILDIVANANIKRTVMLHDYSLWDAEPGHNVHACRQTIASEYSQEFISMLTYYHNCNNNVMGMLIPKLLS